MSCEGANDKPAPTSIKVAAGSSVDLYWAGATGELDGFSAGPSDCELACIYSLRAELSADHPCKSALRDVECKLTDLNSCARDGTFHVISCGM